MWARRWQGRVIRLVGVMEMLAFGAVLMPRTWMEAGHVAMGLGTLPGGPVFEAMMREVSFTYGMHGIGMWFIGGDVVRYRPLVILSAAGYLAAGPAFAVIDWSAGLPWTWHLGNGVSCLSIGLLLAWLLWRDRAAH